MKPGWICLRITVALIAICSFGNPAHPMPSRLDPIRATPIHPTHPTPKHPAPKNTTPSHPNPASPTPSHPAPTHPITIRLDPIITSDSASCIIPFTRIGNLILIQAKADDSTGFFVLDTGTPGLVLNLTYFRHYPSTSKGESGGVTGAVSAAAQTNVDSLRLGPVHYYHLEADLINLGHIENNKGVRILGLLGMRLFERFELIIDYKASVIYLHLIDKKEAAAYRSPQLQDPAAYSTIPFDVEDGKIIVYLYLKGRKLKFIVDSGAETNVLDSRLPGKVFEDVEITRRVKLNGSGSQKVEALYGDIKGLKIGDRELGSLPILITNLESMCDAYNNCLNGMLGFDFLSLHEIGFNFVNRKMYIWK